MSRKKLTKVNKGSGWHGDEEGHRRAYEKGIRTRLDTPKRAGISALGIGFGFLLISVGAIVIYQMYWSNLRDLIISSGIPYAEHLMGVIVFIAFIVLGGIIIVKSSHSKP